MVLRFLKEKQILLLNLNGGINKNGSRNDNKNKKIIIYKNILKYTYILLKLIKSYLNIYVFFLMNILNRIIFLIFLCSLIKQKNKQISHEISL
jgi:hypothetical protein